MNNIKSYLHNNKFLKCFDNAKIIQQKTNFAIDIYSKDQVKSLNPNGKLGNVPFFIKDNFDFEGFKTTSGSKTLKNHISITTATVVKKLMDAGAIPIGKTNLDEFGMGGTGLTSGFGPVVNFNDSTKIVGGSSSGSAVAVDCGLVPFALGTDTGDSIRQPAAWGNNLIGFKPTYGIISRYGIHAFSPSFDTVGFLTKCVKDQAILLSITAGIDEKDFTSNGKKEYDFVSKLKPELAGKKIAIIKEKDIIFKPDVLEKFNIMITKLEKAGAIINYVSINQNILKTIYPVYQSIAFSEALSQLASINGLTFSDIKIKDNMLEDIKKDRTAKFAQLVKERITIGSKNILESEQEEVFLKAKKIRTIIINKLSKIFSENDVVISPVGSPAPKVSKTSLSTNIDLSICDNFLQFWNMNGSPTITIPFDKIGENTISLEISANIFNDQTVLNVALAIETMLKGEFHE